MVLQNIDLFKSDVSLLLNNSNNDVDKTEMLKVCSIIIQF